MRIVVTGATGFLGRHVARRLLRDGHQLVLQGARSLPAATAPCRGIKTGPLEEFADWPALLDGADLVVHLAGRAHVTTETASDPEAAFRAANETAVRRLTDAMRQHGVHRLVHISSIAAKLTVNAYGYSKHAGEAVVADWSSCTGGAAVVLRPPLIYGPDAPGNLSRLIGLIRLKLPLPIATVDNKRSLLAVENAADAIAAIAGCDLSPGVATYEICDDEQVSLPQIVRALSEGLGKPARMLPFPPAIMRNASALVSQSLSDGLFGDLVLDNRPLKSRFDWAPPIATERGLQDVGRSLAGS